MKKIIDFARNNCFGLFSWGGVLLTVALFAALIITSPEFIRISSEEWVCTKAAPNGLATQCNEYQRVVK